MSYKIFTDAAAFKGESGRIGFAVFDKDDRLVHLHCEKVNECGIINTLEFAAIVAARSYIASNGMEADIHSDSLYVVQSLQKKVDNIHWIRRNTDHRHILVDLIVSSKSSHIVRLLINKYEGKVFTPSDKDELLLRMAGVFSSLKVIADVESSNGKPTKNQIRMVDKLRGELGLAA